MIGVIVVVVEKNISTNREIVKIESRVSERIRKLKDILEKEMLWVSVS